MYEEDSGEGREKQEARTPPLSQSRADGESTSVVLAGEASHMTQARVGDVAVSPDGRYVAAAVGKEAILWDAATGDRHRLRRHAKPITSLAFSYDGEGLVTGSRDDSVIKWRTATGKVALRETPQFGDIKDVSYSPDGRWVVTAGPITAALLDAVTCGPPSC